MFTALDTESQVTRLRSQAWLRRSERIGRFHRDGESRSHTPVRAFVTTAARTIIEACPVLRVAFPPAPVSHMSAYQ